MAKIKIRTKHTHTVKLKKNISNMLNDITLDRLDVKASYQTSGGHRDTERVCSAEMSFSPAVTVNCAQVGTVSVLE